MGENICKRCDQQEVNIQNTKPTDTTQKKEKEKKQLNSKME